MKYRVISTFRDPATRELVEPGAACPSLEPEHAERLFRAGCLAVMNEYPVVQAAAPPAETAPVKPKRGRGKAAAPPAEE